MLILFGIYALVCLWQIRLRPPDGTHWQTDYLSRERTDSVKGLFILMVFFAHFNDYVVFTTAMDQRYFYWFMKIGQWMVTMFLFYSGYGVMESIKRSGNAYIRRMPVHRIGRTLLNFDLAVLLYALLALVRGSTVSGKGLLLSLLAWDSLGNSNWYIFMVLAMYCMTFVSFALCREKGRWWPGVLLTVMMIVGLMEVFLKTGLKPTYWYDTALCYGLGMIWSLIREKAEKWINRWDSVYLVLLISAALPAVWYGLRRHQDYIYEFRTMLLFCIAFLLVTMRISFGNPILRWCGRHLFSLYILQRGVMMALYDLGMHLWIVPYFLLALVITVVLAWSFDKMTDVLWKTLCSLGKNKTQSADTAA